MSGWDQELGALPPRVAAAAEADGEGKPVAPAELDLALRFVEGEGDRWRFCWTRATWLAWDERAGIWRTDETGAAFDRIGRLAADASAALPPSKRRAARSARFVAGAERFARSMPAVARTSADFDRDALLLGCPGATVDLRTGRACEPSPDDGITKSCAVAPDFSAACPLWERFLSEATGDDDELVRLLQQWAGYALTGLTNYHALAFIYGSGGNGKSLFVNILRHVLGGYACVAPAETFIAFRNDRHPTELAMLAGARLVVASETDEGRGWAEARIKSLTGGDPITARFMGQDFFTFVPSFKLVVVGNHRPTLRNVDDAMRRRLHIVPFDKRPATPDPCLQRKLKGEAPAILAWAIRGCRDLLEHGFAIPPVVSDATSEYLRDQDLIGTFIDENCELGLTYSATSGDLFAAWTAYAKAAGEHAGTQKRFADALRRRGFEPGRRKIGGRQVRVWEGLRVSAPLAGGDG